MATEKIKPKIQNEIITLSALAFELKVYRSTLDYYMKLGLIIPMSIIGKVNFFDKKLTLDRFKKIKKLQRNGKTLKKIKELLDN